MVVISDTSAISNLFLIDKLWLLPKLYQQVVIPQAVYDELEKIEFSGRKIDVIRDSNWLHIAAVKNKDLVQVLSLTLDIGEAEAISLAKEMNADLLIIDEIKGRDYAKKLNIKIIGLLGILLLAKEKKIILNVKDILIDLREKAGFWISQNLWDMILQLAKED